ncbi:hypothetical protein ABFS82_10G108200 [Erythranthe guttata]|uniref:Uncharacterized protein n=1 Tax=Erythranthe guttata TaxID=4155 RepID=A0A022QM54_ERYGU|nr:hypothetical protein MIMGU_mgv1a021169mg [Erythranthe guttata]
MAAANRWIRPEVYPLFAATGLAVGICGFQLVRNICGNPEVRDNFDEGHKYKERALRKYVRNRKLEIMPSLNSFFTDPQNN